MNKKRKGKKYIDELKIRDELIQTLESEQKKITQAVSDEAVEMEFLFDA